MEAATVVGSAAEMAAGATAAARAVAVEALAVKVETEAETVAEVKVVGAMEEA